MECIFEGCICEAKEREKYFFEDEPMYDMHYAGYLEWLLDSFNVYVSTERAESSFEKYKIDLRPIVPRPKPKKKKKTSSFRMKI
jgi:hypothetical protein